MPMFIGSQSVISLPSFMFVSAVVSEIRDLKEKKKKNSEIDYFQFNTFPGHIIYPFLNRRYLLSTCTDSICWKSPTPQTESDFFQYTIMLAKPGPSLYT